MLTDTAIRVVKCTPGKTVKLSDGGGLQLWVRPSGAKLWNLAYRFGAKQKKLSLGQYPAIGLKDAREKREAAKKALASGRDPGQEKQVRKANARLSQGNTFAAISAELIEKKEREGKAPATIAKIKWMLRLATPFLGPRPIAEINAPEVLVALREAETRGKLETGNIDIFKAALAKRGGPEVSKPEFSGGVAIGPLRHIVVAETDEEALAIAEPAALKHLEELNWLRTKHANSEHAERVNFPRAATLEGMRKEGTFIVGCPQTVIDEIRRQTEYLGTNYLLAYMMFGNMTLKQSMASMNLFHSAVMPAVDRM